MQGNTFFYKNNFWLWFGLLIALNANGYAGNYVVNTFFDPLFNQNYTDMSLRKAVALANNETGKSTITFMSGVTTVYNYGPLITRKEIEIIGNPSVEIRCIQCPAFFVNGATLTLTNMDIFDGYSKGGNGGVGLIGFGGGAAGMGGGLLVNQGKADCRKVRFLGCKAIGGAGGYFDNNIAFLIDYHPHGGGGGGTSGNGAASTTKLPGAGGDGALFNGLGGGYSGNPNRNGGDGSGGGGGEAGNSEGINPNAGHGGFGGGGGGGNIPGNGGFGGGGGGCNISNENGKGGDFGGDQHMGLGGGGAGLGGAIFARSNTELSLTNCEFIECNATGGDGGRKTIDSTTQGNKGQGKGGAIFIMDGAFATMQNNTQFARNNASDSANIFQGENSFYDTQDIYGVLKTVNDDGAQAFPPVSADPNWMFYE